MGMDMRTPCPMCPFRSDIEPYLTVGRVRVLKRDLVDRDASFTCHTTTVPSVDDDGNETGDMHDGPNAQHCAGAMILLHKMGAPNQMMRIVVRIRASREELDRDNPLGLDLDAPVYKDFDEMIRATRAQTRARLKNNAPVAS